MGEGKGERRRSRKRQAGRHSNFEQFTRSPALSLSFSLSLKQFKVLFRIRISKKISEACSRKIFIMIFHLENSLVALRQQHIFHGNLRKRTPRKATLIYHTIYNIYGTVGILKKKEERKTLTVYTIYAIISHIPCNTYKGYIHIYKNRFLYRTILQHA